MVTRCCVLFLNNHVCLRRQGLCLDRRPRQEAEVLRPALLRLRHVIHSGATD